METLLKLKISTGKSRFCFKKNGEVLLVEVKSNPEKGRANNEILKEFRKIFKKEVRLISGFKSREKIIEINASRKEVLEKIET